MFNIGAAASIVGGIAALGQGPDPYTRAAAADLRSRSRFSNYTRDKAKQVSARQKEYDNAAIDHARDVAGTDVKRALGELDRDTRNAGGLPMNSTEFAVDTNAAVGNVYGPLAAFIAQLRATEGQRQVETLVSAMQSDNVASGYAQLAQTQANARMGAYQLIAGGIDKMWPSKTQNMQSETNA